MPDQTIREALTFDDVLLVPGFSEVHPNQVDLGTRLTKDIALRIPLVSAAMDTVTESRMAIGLAQMGGIGIVHKNLSPERQAEAVDKVKRSESGMITDPITIEPDAPIRDAEALMAQFRISGVPVVEGHRLVGILTNRDLRFETRWDIPVREAMTKDNLVTVPVGTTLQEARAILQKHRIEKLLVVDGQGQLKGLITVKDIEKSIEYPTACKDGMGRLRVGAAGWARTCWTAPRPWWRPRWTCSAWTVPTATARGCWMPCGPSSRPFPPCPSSRATWPPTRARRTSAAPGRTP